MSFLVDGPWLYASGRACAALPDPAGRLMGAATVGAFLAAGVALYLNRPWTRPIWRVCRAESGRDWMLNSGVLSVEHRDAGPRTHAVSAVLFATYPLWLWLGYRHGRAA